MLNCRTSIGTRRPVKRRVSTWVPVFVLRALVTPAWAEFAVMEPAELVCMVIQPVGGGLHLVEVVAVIAGRGFLFCPLADNAQFFPA